MSSIQEEVDVEQIRNVFPYGQLLPVEFQRGGMRAASGIELPEMGGAIPFASFELVCCTGDD